MRNLKINLPGKVVKRARRGNFHERVNNRNII